MAQKITGREIEGATLEARGAGKDVWLIDAGARGEGRFMCRCTPAGARVFSYRYVNAAGKRDVLRVASYDPKGQDGLTLEEGRRQAGEWSRLYQSGVRDLREHFERQATDAKAQREAAQDAKAHATRRAKRGSLSALIDAYLGTLEGRASHYDAENILRRHVVEAFPSIASTPASAVKAEQLRDVLAALIGAGKGRTAAKARAYLRAAYSLALRAGLDPTIPQALSDFDVQANPADRLPSLAQFSKALDRALTHAELVQFWRRVEALPVSPSTDALRACILLGGQRPTQLLRLTARDIDLDAGTITLRDIKGRNRHEKPRRHLLPIPADLLPMLTARTRACETLDELVFRSTRIETTGAHVVAICKAMGAANELEKGPFQLRDIRRTAETQLAALGVSSDVRAQLQSHGLGGIQERHYQRHEFLEEKRAALSLWAQRLKGCEPAKVTPISAAKRRHRSAA